MGQLARLLLGPTEAELLADATTPGIEAKLAAAQAARTWVTVATREQAMAHSVVNRSRDLVCSTLGGLAFTRTRRWDGRTETLDPGWLAQPDPTRTRGAFIADVTDDLFFWGEARCQVTARDAEGRPSALVHMPLVETRENPDGSITWMRTEHGAIVTETVVAERDVVHFEGLATGILTCGGPDTLSIARRLDTAALRFAGTETAAGWLQDDGTGEPMTTDEAAAFVRRFQESRQINTIAYLRGVTYHESGMDPSRLQLVEGRGYADATVARVCNMPNFAVGVALPGDSMTYKTALTARWDLIDFGLAPFLATWEQTLSLDTVTPRGTTVGWDLEPFLRSAQLAGLDQPTPPTPGDPNA